MVKISKKMILNGVLVVLLGIKTATAGDRAIEISGSALQQDESKYSVLMDNVSNMKTPGYREARVTNVRGDDGLITVCRYYDHTQGHLMNTGRSLDLALEGRGFFVVQSPAGMLYTRDGRFYVNENKYLCTSSGHFLVQGESGPILFDEMINSIQITETGKLIQDGSVIDRITVADFDDLAGLQPVTNTFFRLPENNYFSHKVLEDYRIKIGYVEGSNVDAAKQLVEIPMIQKSYDANSRMIQLRLKAMSGSLEMGKVQ